MLKRSALLATLALVATLISVSVVRSQDAEKMPDMQAMMKKWMASMTPGPNHKKLDYFVGNWESVTKMWMGGPGAPATESNGTASFKWVLDGRFILHESDGEMMMPDALGNMKPVPHKGMGLTGYDNYRNMYVGTWADNMTTTILTFSGSVDPTGKIFTYYGEMDEPMLDVRGRMIKYVTKIVDDNTFVFEIYDLHAGPDYKVIEINYTRKK